MLSPRSAQPNSVAPPEVTASISAAVRGARRKRSGSSLRSKKTPLGASTGPRCAADWVPMPAPLPWIVLRSGPCCCAWSRYDENEACELPLLPKPAGREPVGEAGCGCGVWSTFSVGGGKG